MFNIELKKKSYKISFKSLLVKIQWSKTDREQGAGGGLAQNAGRKISSTFICKTSQNNTK